ncbi:dolichyl-diphosphooligosaccharide--protein glycosyltransferase subunit 1, putative [Plasmodium malariae]|uniref:Dolichyl-diphosphooligosaccharide--protein glycosyltransferase subunit 1 n=1 Tax=Plasmodium malariae TaxID=5858 RepID=A0A1C3KYV1_PLAMA|nr:dolichyl-diphosphooligosaccharide--protein glycosyltransferase subunit 1, putative [Plasmodium malariae]
MKVIYWTIFLKLILLLSVRGKLDLDLFQNLVNIDIEFLNIYKNKIKEKFVKNADTLVYEHISKNINLKKNYVETTIKGNLKNIGENATEKFIFLLPYHEAFQSTCLRVKDEKDNKLSYAIVKNTEDVDKLKIDKFNYDYNIEDFEIQIYEITLSKQLEKEEQVSVEFWYVLGQPFYPFPVDINLLERQNVMFYLSSRILLPYKVEESEEIKINLCKGCSVVEIDDSNFLKGFEKINNNTYVSHKKKENLKSFSLGNKVLFYFVLDYNLGYFEKVTKDIMISQLGFIYEKEDYILKNNSARINNFDRYVLSDYEHKYTSKEKMKQNETSIIYSMQANMNYNIYEYNYFDDIGKIYLIKGKEFYDQKKKKSIIKFYIKPRYPLLGGWSAYFSNSFYHYSNLFKIKNKKNYYAYKIDISPSIKSFYIKELNIRITLPPYSNDISLSNHYNNFSIHTRKKKAWLDIFTFRNVIELQIKKFFPTFEENYYQNFLVIYEFKFFNIFLKPLLIILISFIFILIFYCLRDLSLNFNTVNENLMQKEENEYKIFQNKCKELYENLSYISDNLIQSLNNLAPQEKMRLKEELLKAEEKWTYDFIYFTKEFYRNFENSTRKKMLQNYIDKCFNYHSVIKKYFEAQLSNSLNINLNEIAQAEKKLLLLLKYYPELKMKTS